MSPTSYQTAPPRAVSATLPGPPHPGNLRLPASHVDVGRVVVVVVERGGGSSGGRRRGGRGRRRLGRRRGARRAVLRPRPGSGRRAAAAQIVELAGQFAGLLDVAGVVDLVAGAGCSVSGVEGLDEVGDQLVLGARGRWPGGARCRRARRSRVLGSSNVAGDAPNSSLSAPCKVSATSTCGVLLESWYGAITLRNSGIWLDSSCTKNDRT